MEYEKWHQVIASLGSDIKVSMPKMNFSVLVQIRIYNALPKSVRNISGSLLCNKIGMFISVLYKENLKIVLKRLMLYTLQESRWKQLKTFPCPRETMMKET